MTNHRLGNTLRTVAKSGASAFYNGSLTMALVKDLQNAGGILVAQDLHLYQ